MLIRNKLYDLNIFHSHNFNLPVICIGNLTVGGTGKTPLTEYLIRLLKDKYNIAVLSRGYKRRTRGFVIASEHSTVDETGDEALQYRKKFPDISVAVDEDRVNGINELLKRKKNLNLIFLDDAFQHRSVNAGLNIMLTDYYNLFYKNYVMPTGTLREFRSGYKRADIIIVTKTPELLSPLDRKNIFEEIKPLPSQKVYFSFIKYGHLKPFNDFAEGILPPRCSYVVLFAGIANPYPLENRIREVSSDIIKFYFRDHHDYTADDIYAIKDKFLSLPGSNKIIVTTEKDVMRLSRPSLLEILKDLPVYYMPIEVSFHDNDKEIFDLQIINFVSSWF